MELTNEFRVPVPADQAWEVLTDVERIAPCMPGAQLQEVEGEEYRGVVKVKVGPITAQYKGKATFAERDAGVRRAVLRAEGRETRGQGNASATITATMEPDGDGTRVKVVTDLTVTGRVAQFGRGVLADVSSRLLDEFAQCLETTVLSGESGGNPAGSDPTGGVAPETPQTTESPPAARRIDQPEPAPVDLLQTAGAPVAKRAVPVLAAVAVLFLLLRGRRRRRRRRR